MRLILLLAAIVLLLALLGWVSVSSGPDRSSINIETDEIKHDTGELMESGADALRRTGEKLDESNAPQSLPPQETVPAQPQTLPSDLPTTLPPTPPPKG